MADNYPKTTIQHLLRRENPHNSRDFVTSLVDDLEIDDAGIIPPDGVLDKHRGHFVVAGVRNDGFMRKGPEEDRSVVFNHRQISVIDMTSLTHIADGMDLRPEVIRARYKLSREEFVAKHIGANVVVGGFDDGSKLNDLTLPYNLGSFNEYGLFETAMLVVSYNEPCVKPGKEMGKAYTWAESEGMGRKFVEVAEAHRGFVGVTSLAGTLSVGQEAMVVPLPQVPEVYEATA